MTTDGQAYQSLRDTIVVLARSRAAELESVPPTTPGWQARDLLAHLGGVCDDVVNGNLEGVGTDPWTAVQVDKRRGWSVEEILVDWERNGEALDALIDQTPPGTFGQLLFDAWTHEQDLRGVLAAPGGRDSVVAGRSYVWSTDAFDQRDREAQRPALLLITDDGTRSVGVGEPTNEVRTSRFELLRAMTGRRSVAQMRGYEWARDADPERLVLAPLFTPPIEDVRE
jgi:uncharacterized protein (TIGR03083 family)